MELTKRDDSVGFMQVIERLATNPESDIAKLEKMLDMQERILDRQSQQAFNAAMAMAQSEMGRVSADASNPQTGSKYASYAAIDKEVRPIYTRHGFALSFDTEPASEGIIRIVCIVSHRDGYSRTYRADMPADGLGAKGNAVMTKTHAAGSAMSYGQRYLLKMIFNVAVGEDDVDGNVYQQEIMREYMARVEQATTAKELIQVKKEATPLFSRARDRDGYKMFLAAVSEKMDDIQGGENG